MPINTNIQVPFVPQTGITNAILQAIQLANEAHAQRVQQGLQQQQVGMQAQALPGEIAFRQAQTDQANAATEMQRVQLQMRREMLGTLLGQSPDAAPVQQPAPPQQAIAVQPGAPAQGGVVSVQPSQPAVPSRGLIGDTVTNLLQDPTLSSEEKQALGAAGRGAIIKAFQDPSTAMDGIVSTYNDILKQHGDNARAIKTETKQDPNSTTGYSVVASRPDGSEAYRIVAPAPVPKNLEEASSYLGGAKLAYDRDPTPGNKAAMELFQSQHNAMYSDKMAELQRQTQVEAQARGTDYEAMLRTGINPITKEKLSLDNAPPSALVNPATGQVIPSSMAWTVKPSPEEKQTADTARQVLAISQDLRNEVTKNPGLIGAIAGRSQEALQKAGLSSQDAAKTIDDISFLQSASTKMHTGRFSGQILDKMGNIIKPGMNMNEFLGSLDSVHDVAQRYANEDKLTTVYEYQQRQQYENQGAGGNPFVPGQFSANNPFAPQK